MKFYNPGDQSFGTDLRSSLEIRCIFVLCAVCFDTLNSSFGSLKKVQWTLVTRSGLLRFLVTKGGHNATISTSIANIQRKLCTLIQLFQSAHLKSLRGVGFRATINTT